MDGIPECDGGMMLSHEDWSTVHQKQSHVTWLRIVLVDWLINCLDQAYTYTALHHKREMSHHAVPEVSKASNGLLDGVNNLDDWHDD